MGTESRITAAYPQESDTRRAKDALAARLAAAHRHLITAAKLREIGFSDGTIRDRVRSGRLHRVLPGVYSLAPPPFGLEQRWTAALLACGPGSLLSHFDSAALLGIGERRPGPISVTVPPQSGRRSGQRKDIVVHRSVVLPCDTAGRDGILCTSAARTILDLASLAAPAELERILIAADSLRILNRGRLQELVDGSRGRRGIRTLRSQLAADPVKVRSDRETEMLFVCRLAGLPEPVVNGRVEGLEVDFHWPALRLVVEVDGWRFHGGRERANNDRDRDQRLAMAGWQVVRFTRDQIVADPAACADRLARIATVPRVGEPADQGRRSRSGLRP